VAPGLLFPRAPRAEPLEVTLDDPTMGRVRLRALFGGPRHGRAVAVIVPGLTGTPTSPYLAHAVRAAESAGFAHLRIGMRGTDRTGEDIWHGGLTADLHATLAHPALERFERIVVVGYSVGGHASLCAATEAIDSRVAAVASLCAPLDLELGTQEFDRPGRRLYRRAILSALDQIYAATHARRGLPTPVEVVRRARSSRERDALAIAPRFGFTSAEDYYARASVAPRLGRVRVPALVVAALGDPIVPPSTLYDALRAARDTVSVRWVKGGHVAFAEPVERDVFAWLKGAL
jgi:predicted alpha/beta-fold hydrolase